jgi:hypothetical protein
MARPLFKPATPEQLRVRGCVISGTHDFNFHIANHIWETVLGAPNTDKPGWSYKNVSRTKRLSVCTSILEKYLAQTKKVTEKAFPRYRPGVLKLGKIKRIESSLTSKRGWEGQIEEEYYIVCVQASVEHSDDYLSIFMHYEENEEGEEDDAEGPGHLCVSLDDEKETAREMKRLRNHPGADRPITMKDLIAAGKVMEEEDLEDIFNERNML